MPSVSQGDVCSPKLYGRPWEPESGPVEESYHFVKKMLYLDDRRGNETIWSDLNKYRLKISQTISPARNETAYRRR